MAANQLIASTSRFLIFFVVGCSSCAVHRDPSSVPVARDVTFSLLPPNSLGKSLALTQRLRFLHGETSFVFSSILEIDREQITVVGIGPMGSRVFAVKWDGVTFWEDRERISEISFDLRYLLIDLQTVLFPKTEIQAAYRGSTCDSCVTVQEVGLTRQLFLYDSPMVKITYETGKPWEGKVIFENLLRGYRFEIETIRMEELRG